MIERISMDIFDEVEQDIQIEKIGKSRWYYHSLFRFVLFLIISYLSVWIIAAAFELSWRNCSLIMLLGNIIIPFSMKITGLNK